MFAKPRKNGRDAGQTYIGRFGRPESLPSSRRFDLDGKLQRTKTAPSKPKLPKGRNRCGTAKRPPVPDEYAHIRSPIGDYIRRPFISSFSGKQLSGCGRESTQDASPQHLVKVEVGSDVEEVELELGSGLGFKCSLGIIDSLLEAGIAEVQQCKTTSEVFKTYRKTFHNILDRATYVANTANSSTQTSPPKLRRTQTNLIYAGFWESSTSRQNRGMQTEDQNLTVAKQQPAVMHDENSKSNWTQLFGWIFVAVAFFILGMIFGLII